MLEKIVVGYDFAFGKEKRGDGALLSQLFEGEVEIVGEICSEGIPVHSRTIRTCLREGEIEMANRLLGRCYSIEGEVVSGQGLGKKELVPTLNLHVEHYQLPLEGVYATRTKIGEAWYDSVSFLGHRITTDGTFAVESHIIGREMDVREGKLQLAFRAFLRENRQFPSLEALKAQIEADIRSAQGFLS